MSLRIRRGTDAQRATTPLDLGELVFTTDTKQLYVGNGIDNGGNPIIRLGTGLAWSDASCTTIVATGAALQVSADATPSLGGDLTLNSHDITGTGNINITGTIAASGLTLTNNGINSTTNYFNIGVPANAIGTTTVHSQSLTVKSTTTAGGVIEASLDLNISRGTLSSPIATNVGDLLTGISFKGYDSGAYNSKAIISGRIDSRTGTEAYPGSISFVVKNFDGVYTNVASMNSRGVLKGLVLSCSQVADNAARLVLVPTPAAGMIILNGSTFQGYNGTAWVNLN